MTTPDFPLRLRREIEGDADPVAIFRELVEVPSVSFNEFLLYQYLRREFDELYDELPTLHRDKLLVTYSPAGQLLARWRGRPTDPRRTLLVAHVDREGFLVRRIDRARALCWHTAGDAPEEHTIGRRVRILTRDRVLKGKVDRIGGEDGILSAQMPFNHQVDIAIEESAADGGTSLIENDYFQGIGYYDIPHWDERDGVIAATTVDNTAGVSVLTAVMKAVVRGNWKVNVDCLYTTCEEAGFCGIVAEILDGSSLAAIDGEPVVCIVVDSSSQMSFQKEDSWEPPPGPWATPPEASRESFEIPLQEPVIRTGDKRSLYDIEVARLLRAAANNLEGETDERDWMRPRRSPSYSGGLRRALEVSSTGGTLDWSGKRRARVGRLVGGWCEATPLVHANAIRRRALLSSAPLALRVGALAIPIAAYRNSFKQDLQPEKCHPHALRGTCQILGEAVRLCHRWPFGLIDSNGVDGGPMQEQIVDDLLRWQTLFQDLSSVTRNWTREAQPGV